MSAPQPPVVYGSSFEALFVRALQPTGAFLDDLRACGFDPYAVRHQYPEATFIACLDVARRHVCRGRSTAEANHHLGRLFATGFLETLAGKVVKMTLRMLGPARVADSVPRYLAMGLSGAKAEVLRTGERSRRIRFTETDTLPDFLAGCVESGLEAATDGVQVRVEEVGPRSYALCATW